MRLYHFPPAPNPSRVLFYLREKGIEDIELVLVDFFKKEQNSPEHLARSPRGVVPVLELDDGTCLSESVAIIEYLEECYPQPPMLGSTAVERAQVRASERWIELNVLLPVVRIVHASKSPLGLPANPALVEYERPKLKERLAYLDDLVGGNTFVLGDAPTIADCSLLAAFNFSRLAGTDDLHGWPNLNRWFESYALRHL